LDVEREVSQAVSHSCVVFAPVIAPAGVLGKPKLHLVTSFWFAFGSPEQARAQVQRHLRRYMNCIPGRVRRRDGAHDRLGRH